MGFGVFLPKSSCWESSQTELSGFNILMESQMIAVIKENHRPTVMFDDLEMAFSLISDAYAYEAAAFICRKTGKIYWESSELGDDFEAPDDVGDSDLYVPIPDKRNLDLGVRLVFQFVRRQLPTHYERVSTIFRRRGAYG